jgi:hypothetical protein
MHASEGDAWGQIDSRLDYVFRLLGVSANLWSIAIVAVRSCPSSFFDKRNKVASGPILRINAIGQSRITRRTPQEG